MAEKRVLVIDDEYDFMEGDLKRGLGGHGFQVEGTIDPSKALALIKSEKPDVILLDIFFPEGEMGKPTLEKIKKKYPSYPPVIMISDTMLKSKYNAEDYQLADSRYPKELLGSKDDFDDFAREMHEWIDRAKDDARKEKDATGNSEFGFIVGNTRLMKNEVAERIKLVADTDENVLITGEPGTGKELVARAIRKLSNRNKQPFIAQNCGALPDDLIESELFGYKTGAFTNALRDKPGRFALAEGGTIFLDEIGDITPALQVKLLRVLREKTYEPLGATKTLKADVRIIAATNKNLPDLVRQGNYRKDLYDRLNVFPISLPPLRDRKEDIPLLFRHFIDKQNTKVKSELRDDVKELLFLYPWPGNICELENAIKSAVIFAKNDKFLQLIHFPHLTEKGKSSQKLPLDIPDIVDRLYNGEWNWENIKAEYAAKGDTRREILLQTIYRWKEKHGHRPKSEDLADLLSVSNSNIRRILAEHGIKLTQI